MYEKQFTNATIFLRAPITDTLGNSYQIFIPKAEITALLPSGGNNDILNSTFEYKVVEADPTITRIPAPVPNSNP